MNILRKINLLIMMIVPLNIMSMEVKQTSLANISTQENNGVMPKEFPVEVKIKIFKDMIDAVQTVPECDNLFKAVIKINKDLPKTAKEEYKLRFFRSALFNEIGLKKYKILCTIENQLKNIRMLDFDVINKGIDTRDKNSETPLIYAAAQGYVDIVSLLIKNGAFVDAQTKTQETPLLMAAYYKRFEVVDLLIKNGALVNVQDYMKWTPLHHASYWQEADIARLLIQNGALVNVQDDNRWTPLHRSASNGNVEITDLLIKNGADIDLLNKQNETALDVARRNKNEVVVDLLKTAQS